MPSPIATRTSSPSPSQIDTQSTPLPRGRSERTGGTVSPPEVDRNASTTGGLSRRASPAAQQRRPVTTSALPTSTSVPNVAGGSQLRGTNDGETPTTVTAEQVATARQGMLDAMANVPGEGKEMAFFNAFLNAPAENSQGSEGTESIKGNNGNSSTDGSQGPATPSAKAIGKQAAHRASGSSQQAEISTPDPLAGMVIPNLKKMSPTSLIKTAEATIGTLKIDVPPEEQKAAEKGGAQISNFLATGNVPSGSRSAPRIGGNDNALAIERLSEEVISQALSLVGPNATPEERSAAISVTFVQRMSQLYGNAKALPSRIAANDFESGTAKAAASVVNVAARNALSVLGPTTVRQMISYGIEKGLTESHNNHHGTQHVSDAGRIALGTAVALLPVALHLVGALRDHTAKTETTTSIRSRAIMGGLTLAAVVAGLATGVMRETAVQIVAFTIYTAMRDLLVQSRIKLENVNSSGEKPDATHFGLISVGYGVDQGLVNLAMSTKASPSGPSAYINKAGLRADNAGRRGGINYSGEIAEDLMFNAIPAVREGRPLQLALKDAGWTKNGLANAALGPWAVRSGILTMSLIGSNIIAQHLGTQGHSAAELEGVSDMFYALLNGVLYEPFANAGSAQPQSATAHHDEESTSMSTLDDDRHSYQSPDVLMTNDAAVHARHDATLRPADA